MKNPIEFYISEKVFFEKKVNDLKRKLAVSSTIRLLVFLATSLGIYFYSNNSKIMIPIAVIGVICFIYLIFRHAFLQDNKRLYVELTAINKKEIEVLNDNYFNLNKGEEFIDATHFYSFDIDLFGKGSFFQYCNRTTTTGGREKFVKTLTENHISDIDLKQEAIKELANHPKWRQQFSAIASLVKVQHSPKSIVNWIHNYTSVFSKSISLLLVLFPIISFVVIALVSIQVFPFKVLVYWFFIGLGVSMLFLKKVNKIYETSGKAKDTFKQYHQLLNKIESIEFNSVTLKEKQQDIQSKSLKASVIFEKFSKILEALDQRNNMMVAVFLNSLLLWDVQQVVKIEKWITTYRDTVENWFDIISFFDAQNSLANFTFNHPNSSFPEISKENLSIEATNLGHPLLKESTRINNDFAINSQHFFIVTGANMAGKSTFLRTVSLAIVMANMGLPVCAKSFKYSPVKLITSMRTSDSLADKESYFFSELKRLKFIVDEIKNEDYFIILDEILKGTNSVDKAIGSKKFVQKLVSSKSTGIIATHDLSLCEIEKDLPEVENFYFDAEIINNELNFDYKFKDGICKNMNASFLLKKMEII
tara:strand:+ start:30978 stop:32747 length:1770 start_codon:yes stop_codon:yes gene_type:complete